MSKDKFALGIDYGTESGRAVVVRLRDGKLLSSSVVPYPDGVIDDRLPGGAKLEPDWALQNPLDYLYVLEKAVPKALKDAKVKAQDVIGIGTDFTASSPMPAKADGTALSALPKFRKVPHAYVKLWKHHAAQPEANRINEIGRERNEDFIRIYGGKYSSEWFFSKLLQVVDEAPDVYDAMDRFIEAGDWLVWQLTGQEKRNTCTAGYKGMWVKGRGFPSSDFFRALHPRMENVIIEKVGEDYFPLGAKAGGLTAFWAKKMGLKEGTPVAIGNVDAHVAVPACTVTEPGALVMIMGTSICHMLLGSERQMVEGMCGVVEDGIVPGLWGYEAGQSAVGDIFAWFFEHAVPDYIYQEARKKKVPFQEVLEKRASALKTGEAGLLALDWWNGNRSVLVDVDLTGLMLGMTLATRAEEIYRALIEATAFGTRTIVEAFESKGITVNKLVACGGLPERNHLLMQIYADVTGREINLADPLQTCSALGAAMHGAVAAGQAAGGYDSIADAARQMARVQKLTFKPHGHCHEIYDKLYADYRTLHDYFGRGANDVMKRLKSLRREIAMR